MLTSEQTVDILTALLAARSEFPAITRNRNGHSRRTGQRYKYADLNGLIDATTPVLGQHGLLLMQALDDGEGGTLQISTTLFHVASGQWISSKLSVDKPTDMQDLGSEATFLKRYSMQAILNISTEEDDDAASLNGSSKPEKPAAAEKSRPSVDVKGNGHTPAPEADTSLDHPTESHLAALKSLACTECQEPVDVFEDRIRTTAKLPKHASVSFRLLVKTLPMSVYVELFAYYRRLESQIEKSHKEVVPDGAESASEKSAEPQPEQPTATEVPPTDPQPAAPEPSSAEALSSAPEPDAAERDRVRLRAEVANWNLRISDKERDHVIQHNGYSRARQLLWKTRVDAPTATPIEVAAD